MTDRGVCPACGASIFLCVYLSPMWCCGDCAHGKNPSDNDRIEVGHG